MESWPVKYAKSVRRIHALLDKGRRLADAFRALSLELESERAERERQEAEKEEMRWLAYHDELTGLPNRRFLIEMLGAHMDIARHNNEPLAIAIVDIDGLKRANKISYDEGNRLINTVGWSLHRLALVSDLAGRLGGDEFGLVIPGFRSAEGVTEDELIQATYDVIKKVTQEAIDELGLPTEVYASASVGIATLKPGDSTSTLLHRADVAQIADKEQFYDNLAAQGIVFQDERKLAE